MLLPRLTTPHLERRGLLGTNPIARPNGETGRRGDGETGRRGDRETGRWAGRIGGGSPPGGTPFFCSAASSCSPILSRSCKWAAGHGMAIGSRPRATGPLNQGGRSPLGPLRAGVHVEISCHSRLGCDAGGENLRPSSKRIKNYSPVFLFLFFWIGNFQAIT